MSPQVNITGSVSNSQIFVAGGSITVGGDVSPALAYRRGNRVLFPSLDWELRAVSIASGGTAYSFADAAAIAKAEMRALLLALPPEGQLVLPPSYYCESELSRAVLVEHVAAIESGHVRLIGESSDFDDYILEKRDRYAKAAHFPRYWKAYFAPAQPSLASLPFKLSQKESSVGALGLELWSGSLETATTVPEAHLRELRARALDTERRAFLWENLAEHMSTVGIAPLSRGGLQVRQLKNRAYLAAYQRNGIAIPVASALVADAVTPASAANDYNLASWAHLSRLLGIERQVLGLKTAELLGRKFRPEVAAGVALARRSFVNGEPSDQVAAKLERRGMADTMRRGLELQ